MREIRGDAKSIRSLLQGARFAIDYYQREYRWEAKQITELIDDLAEKFLDSYKEGDERSAVENYGHYFLGSIIISDKDSRKFIIDGQQRITSITLLLIYLYRHLEDEDDKRQLADLIFSLRYGKRSFNLEVDERTPCMEAIFKGERFDEEGKPESVVNILDRFRNIEDHFPDDLAAEALPYFSDWLIENVHLVEITAYSDADAYTIFETMNDRGLSLTPTDMLKGYLLANITDTERRNAASEAWKERIVALQELGKDEDADSIKAWLRSQHAQTTRERRRGARPLDFDLIGTEFHRWVRDHRDALSLKNSAAFSRFIQEDFDFYSRWYERIRKAEKTLIPGMEAIHFNAWHGFTLQRPTLLAPLLRNDSEDQIFHKLRIVAVYLDILITLRIWNWRSTSYSTMQYAMFQLVKRIRGKPVNELADILVGRLHAEELSFNNNDYFSLHGRNGPQVHQLLARMTDYVEICSGQSSRYTEYIQRSGRNGYQIEHIWADHPERHTDDFDHPADFDEYRNRIGGLLLLPRSFNASFGDLDYGEKREHYNSRNLLARSLHEQAYDHNPGFRRFVDESSLPFRPHATFRKQDLDARQELYRQIAEQIWNPDILRREAEE